MAHFEETETEAGKCCTVVCHVAATRYLYIACAYLYLVIGVGVAGEGGTWWIIVT